MASPRFDRNRPDVLRILETDSGPDETLGANYVADEALEDAINVSLILGRPLLVTGAPGCGKTQLGYAIARNLGRFASSIFLRQVDVRGAGLVLFL